MVSMKFSEFSIQIFGNSNKLILTQPNYEHVTPKSALFVC